MRELYKEAGVNVEAGYEAVEGIKKHVDRTKRPGVMGSLGGFGGLFDLAKTSYQNPVLVSGTDGVGTKLKLAIDLDQHDTIGIDAVAMCVNDILVQGAEPLFFLDYIACGRNVPARIEAIVKGIADGCEQAGCALIGGETAEMPGMYNDEDYDVAGFVVGAVEKDELITGEAIQEGDQIIGLSSSGIHSNGYSLVRKWIEAYDLNLSHDYDLFPVSLGDTLLTPTKIYAQAVQSIKGKVAIQGMAHITGGGFEENIPRMLPDGLGVTIQRNSWAIPPIYDFLMERSSVSSKEMYSIFNMGIGMAIVVRESDVEMALSLLEEALEEAWVIGSVTGTEGVAYE
ncbi:MULTISPECIES: phosphoribosylformylglycinamidine cyclo-ligase [Pontibacillus]|uniref:Phosphoribosylformylglycinamidine cyclo-ligase n=1 Tax=Pontibacillus chungwhensis TaxID=265426 RepID=A0ABY8UY85_9BACI|nr:MULTISPECIES: phosphoribosylformylglycinamidine cyclo-ligase [Pontibacillus]MCD5325346.1 phosphoribosylformylglycinamidine cyclo-ligase [Pontibacillus sp. HN14]WIF98464.1 phosphoribosylformylglycinamidine cyclo-ligase [Pontibacillus chungwhensis]